MGGCVAPIYISVFHLADVSQDLQQGIVLFCNSQVHLERRFQHSPWVEVFLKNLKFCLLLY